MDTDRPTQRAAAVVPVLWPPTGRSRAGLPVVPRLARASRGVRCWGTMDPTSGRGSPCGRHVREGRDALWVPRPRSTAGPLLQGCCGLASPVSAGVPCTRMRAARMCAGVPCGTAAAGSACASVASGAVRGCAAHESRISHRCPSIRLSIAGWSGRGPSLTPYVTFTPCRLDLTRGFAMVRGWCALFWTSLAHAPWGLGRGGGCVQGCAVVWLGRAVGSVGEACGGGVRSAQNVRP
mmetsp:Transcript_10711/g.28057  ORF Transcript_10711/g.28057 Transcript_10711/m.28057 type:complete len:236 (-) Transcript_10711:726-1433(-)